MAQAPLSFCLVSTFYPPASFGGDAVHVHRLANGLAERGHRVRVVHSPTAYRLLAGSSTPATGHTDHPGVEVVADGAAAADVAATYLSGRPLRLRRRIEGLLDGFDVVQFNNPSLLGGPGAFGIGSALKLYCTLEHWLLCPTHVLFRNGREVCTERTCWRCSARYRRPPQLWRSTGLLQREAAHLDLLLCPSRFTADLHRAAFPQARIEVLPLLAPPDGVIAAVPEAPEPDRPYFLYAGRLEAIKGVETLVRAFREVRGADLLVIGDGTLAPRLRDLAAPNPAIRFLGRRPYTEVLGLSRAARAVVVPSAGYETFGIVAVEAMAVGAPVVVRDLGPLPELIADGGGVSFRDEADLARILQEMAGDAAPAREMGMRARASFESRWAQGRFFARYFELLASAAGDAGRHTLAERAATAAT